MNDNQDFDLLTLLKSGDFDIRSIAAAKSPITLKEYFNLMSRFTGLVPEVSGALTKFAALAVDEKAVECLSDIAALMVRIGCDKYLEINSIIDAYNRGDTKAAAGRAKEISGDFIGLYTRTMAARKKHDPPDKADASDEDELSFDDDFKPGLSLSLKEVLQQLDEREANRKLRILAIDDSTVMLKTISSVLSEQYKVFTLAKPKMLENLLQQITPELFLLDYKMPELSGFDLIPIIRSFKEHKDTPIIFLTSEGTVETLSAAVMLGACDFLAKPLHPEILREKIANHIVRKKLF